MPRNLKSMGGSFNELEELQLILHNRKKDEHSELINRYGSGWTEEIEARREATKQAKIKEDVSELEAKVKEEKEHNAARKKEVDELYKAQKGKDAIKAEELGWTTV